MMEMLESTYRSRRAFHIRTKERLNGRTEPFPRDFLEMVLMRKAIWDSTLLSPSMEYKIHAAQGLHVKRMEQSNYNLLT
jgi:hypothetical protein